MLVQYVVLKDFKDSLSNGMLCVPQLELGDPKIATLNLMVVALSKLY